MQPMKGAGQKNRLLPKHHIAIDDALTVDPLANCKEEVAYLGASQKLPSEPGDEISTSFLVFQNADVEYVALDPIPRMTAKSKALAGICKLKSATEWINRAALLPIHASKTERR
jgi:hypothetical protein